MTSQIQASQFPVFTQGLVVKGFGRGSKELGIPTANFPDATIEALPKSFTTGVYFGWASVSGGEALPMVMSIGWNPYYKNERLSMETHIMHAFGRDFYDEIMRVCIAGWIRGEEDFKGLDDLIAAIHADIAHAHERLAEPESLKLKSHAYFSTTSDSKDAHHVAASNGHPPTNGINGHRDNGHT